MRQASLLYLSDHSADLVIRKVIRDRPVAVTYELTEFGRSALDILDSLRVWSASNEL